MTEYEGSTLLMNIMRYILNSDPELIKHYAYPREFGIDYKDKNKNEYDLYIEYIPKDETLFKKAFKKALNKSFFKDVIKLTIRKGIYPVVSISSQDLNAAEALYLML